MVLHATTEYRAEEDVLLRFIHSDYLELSREYKCGAHALHKTYKTWTKNNHEDELSERKFAEGMKAHGYIKLPRTAKGIQYAGIRMVSECFEQAMPSDIM